MENFEQKFFREIFEENSWGNLMENSALRISARKFPEEFWAKIPIANFEENSRGNFQGNFLVEFGLEIPWEFWAENFPTKFERKIGIVVFQEKIRDRIFASKFLRKFREKIRRENFPENLSAEIFPKIPDSDFWKKICLHWFCLEIRPDAVPGFSTRRDDRQREKLATKKRKNYDEAFFLEPMGPSGLHQTMQNLIWWWFCRISWFLMLMNGFKNAAKRNVDGGRRAAQPAKQLWAIFLGNFLWKSLSKVCPQNLMSEIFPKIPRLDFGKKTSVSWFSQKI